MQFGIPQAPIDLGFRLSDVKLKSGSHGNSRLNARGKATMEVLHGKSIANQTWELFLLWLHNLLIGGCIRHVIFDKHTVGLSRFRGAGPIIHGGGGRPLSVLLIRCCRSADRNW